MIELNNLTRSFGDHKAVDNLNLKVETGEICALIGTSGCGKSTTLKMINRLIEPSSGTVLIDGEDIRNQPPEQLRRKIGYAIQGVGLFPHRSVYENIATVPRLLGWSSEKIDARVHELLELLKMDFDSFAHRKPNRLSGGEQQRIGVARALAANPDLMLMDEPFGALDPLTRERLQLELKQIQKLLGITIILVTHDIEEAIRLADRIAVMDGGRLLQQATPEELLRNPREGFVSNLVGGEERALRLLSLRSIGDLMEPAECFELNATTPSIEASATLRDALARQIWQQSPVLRVTGENGDTCGAISMERLLSLGQRPG
ncbi:ABC transporter ATP-binding protein [Marinobacterium mangrovicola]|uniref:Osmoprotectant transport system ATP-binding protein n=1 Tax=Marinobacterium mangrovicola TaxID=1476959 RepID=A0A4R1GXW7_9GAMM|nr:ABC transporter ATP-binding protein [Marinobacterium mangrovicola]TCK09302.1 osmoprotectant transport system ATP-binding protein [Marinobacterium mangrovicola]